MDEEVVYTKRELGGVPQFGISLLNNSAVFLPDTSSNTQVLLLHGLALTLGDTYVVQWEAAPEENQRIDCHPEENANEMTCRARGCIWKVRGDTNGSPMPTYTLFLYSENPYAFLLFPFSASRHRSCSVVFLPRRLWIHC